MMEALGMAPKQPDDGPKPSLLEREMETIGLLRNGPDNTDDEDGEEVTSLTQQDSDETEIYKSSYATSKKLPRRPGRPVRRQRPLVD